LAHLQKTMAIRFHLLNAIRDLGQKIAVLEEAWAKNYEPKDTLVSGISSDSPEQRDEKGKVGELAPYQVLPLTNQGGEVEAGLRSDGLEESSQIIERIRSEDLYGAGGSNGGTISKQVGDAVAGLTPTVMTA